MKENINTKKIYVIKGDLVLGLIGYFKSNLPMDKAEDIVNNLRNLSEIKQENKNHKEHI